MRPTASMRAVLALALVSGASALPSLLVFSATTGFRHESIPIAIEVLRSQASAQNVTFDFTEDATRVNADTLSQYDALLFLMTTGQEVLSADQQSAFNDYLRSGGAYIGVHSASDCLQDTGFYNQTIGAMFDYHPPIQDATFMPVTKDHPATADFPDQWRYQEEVYFFRSDPRDNGATVILTVDMNSFQDNGTSTGNYPSQGDPHPIAWYIESPASAEPLMEGAPKAGRSFYTSLGHLDSTWQDERFTNHLMGGLRWALDGQSTRAYGVGLVGNSTDAVSSSPSSSPSSSSATIAGSSSSSGTSQGQSSSASAASGSASTSPNAALGGGVEVWGGMFYGFLGVLASSLAGMALAL